ncbi:MAG: Uma2 family endonuclease, partial [Flavisolibacter sp.]|nr:Uma2 family endonuclease [Flavisolibacter sp.]
VEVLSPSTHIMDTVDKYIAYTTIPSLKYYLIVEPETVYVTLYSKNGDGKWEAMSYVRKTDVIPLPLLEISLPLSEVYK